MLDLCSCSSLFTCHLSILAFIINQSPASASHFLPFLPMPCSAVLLSPSPLPPTLPVISYIHLSPLIQQLKGPVGDTVTGKSSSCFLASLTPVSDFNMISEAICIPFVAIESYQSALFPLVMLTDYQKSAQTKQKNQERENEHQQSDPKSRSRVEIANMWSVVTEVIEVYYNMTLWAIWRKKDS